MPDPSPVPAVSPTGKAIVPPAVIPWLMVGVACVNAILVQLAQSAPNPTLKTWAALGASTIAPLVAMASPGLRAKS